MEPLVSILVITYNSSKTVLETLDSAKLQDYSNIELIISDDCSTDDTAEICNTWLDNNKERFVRALLIKADENHGVSANCNQAIRAAQGEWGKIIAGDDILLPNCISSNVKFLKDNPDAKFIFSQMTSFVVEKGEKKLHVIHPEADRVKIFQASAEEQHKVLFDFSFPPTPTFFFQMETMKQNLYNERYKYCEDYPQFFLLTGKGYRFYLNLANLVLYRKEESLYHSSTRFFNESFVLTYKEFFYNEMAGYLFANNKIVYNKHIKKILLYDFAIIVLKNKKTVFNKLLYKIAKKFLQNI